MKMIPLNFYKNRKKILKKASLFIFSLKKLHLIWITALIISYISFAMEFILVI